MAVLCIIELTGVSGSKGHPQQAERIDLRTPTLYLHHMRSEVLVNPLTQTLETANLVFPKITILFTSEKNSGSIALPNHRTLNP
jgi:hypothetical protein